LLWANSFAKACSMEANPFECFCMLTVAFSPVFDCLDLQFAQDTNTRVTNDHNKHVIEMKSMLSKDEILPMSIATGNKSKFNFDTQKLPSLWTSVSSILFMMYLLSRKHEVTPDLFHFVTCMPEDFQHMLWLVFLWLCFR